MCLLIYAQPGATPTKKSLRNAGSNNPDGFGFAFRLDGRIVRHRTMDLEESIALFHEMRADNPQAHAIWHARITTHGATNLDNCHPFMVDDGIVLGHNGMLPIQEADGKSDTRQFAEEWLPKLGVSVLDDPTEYKEIEKFASGSKLAVLSVNPVLERPVYLINEHLGHWDKGVWYSNNSYQYEWFSLASISKYTSTVSQRGVTPSDDSPAFGGDEDDAYWYDEETGDLYSWDNRHGWVVVEDDEQYFAQYCFECGLDMGVNGEHAVDKHYCWDCGSCLLCGREYNACYCGTHGV